KATGTGLNDNAVQIGSGVTGTVTNLGAITAASTVGYAIDLEGGGSVTNGASGSTASQITGGFGGIVIRGSTPSTVVNLGTIDGLGDAGVIMDAGGSVTNGPSGSNAALITGGYFGIVIIGSAGTVTNLGTISGSNAVRLFAGGSMTNGASGSTAGLVAGG